jgi:hypothetical protein
VTEQQLARMAKRRLAILRHAEEITGEPASPCTPGGTTVDVQCGGSDRCTLSGYRIARKHSARFKGRFRCPARR